MVQPDRRTFALLIGAWWGDAVARRLTELEPSFEWWAHHISDGIDYVAKSRYVFALNVSGKLPAWFVRENEVVNFHCTDLPYGRGGGPIENLILRGHTDTIITAHRMTEEIDGGPVYMKLGPISLDGSKVDIQERFIEPVTEMVRRIVRDEPVPYEQHGRVVRWNRLPSEQAEEIWRRRRER